MLRERIKLGLAQLLDAHAHGGIRGCGKLIASRLFRRSRSLLFCCREAPDSPTLPPELTIQRVTKAADASLREDLLQAGAGDDLHLFDRGAVCYLARWAGQPVGAGWLFRESYLLAHAGCSVNGRYLGGFQVVETHRGKGIYTALLKVMAADVLPNGKVPYIDTTADNLASRRGIEKAGFTCVGTLQVTILLGLIIHCRVVPPRKS